MIENKKDLKYYIIRDAYACGRKTPKARFFGDEIWKFQICLRKNEYYNRKTAGRIGRFFETPLRMIWHYKFHKYSVKLGFSVPMFVFKEGLAIVHSGLLVVSNSAVIGKNCRIHEGVTIGATNGSDKAPVIGDNVFIGSGAKILGNIHIADNVAIGANAVVVKSIEEGGTTWGGVPAGKISDNDSRSNLSDMLFK